MFKDSGLLFTVRNMNAQNILHILGILCPYLPSWPALYEVITACNNSSRGLTPAFYKN